MDIFLKYELFYDEEGKLAFNEAFFDKQRETLESLFGEEPLDIRVFQRDFEKRLFDRNDNYSPAVQTIINDIKDPDSVLSFLFKDKYLDKDISELDRKILIFKQVFITLVMRQYRSPEEKGCYYLLNYDNKLEFKFFLPISIIATKYKEEFTEIDLSKLSTDEVIENIVPDYYLAIGYWDKDKLRADKEKMATFGREWFNEYNQIVPIVI